MARNTQIVDVLIIGAGASGGAFAWSLAEAGINVMCLEQGDWVDPSTYPSTQTDWEIRRQTNFNPNPNFRGLPQDYPVNESGTPIAPLMFKRAFGRGGRQHYSLERAPACTRPTFGYERWTV